MPKNNYFFVMENTFHISDREKIEKVQLFLMIILQPIFSAAQHRYSQTNQGLKLLFSKTVFLFWPNGCLDIVAHILKYNIAGPIMHKHKNINFVNKLIIACINLFENFQAHLSTKQCSFKYLTIQVCINGM